MSVLIVTYAKTLPDSLANLNPEIEYAAIVVDNVESAKKNLAQVGLSKNFVCPMEELTNCIEYLWYDYIFCLGIGWGDKLLQLVQEYGAPKDKIVEINFSRNDIFLTERSHRYFKEHCAEFDMFATGISYAETGLNVDCFKRKIFNFARSSQDLYYNFQTAKFAVLCGGGIVRYVMRSLAWHRMNFIMTCRNQEGYNF